ncbi:MAG: hypothetical protein R3F49_23075 [Planctomycetota bacterium]
MNFTRPLLFAWLALGWGARAEAQDVRQLTVSCFDALEQYIEVAESRWEDTFQGRLKRRDGTALGANEVSLPLVNAREALGRMREQLAASAKTADEDRERVAMAAVELRWSLALEEARRLVGLARAEDGGATAHDQAGRRLQSERRALIEEIDAWIALARRDGRDFAWEAWAELADASFDVKAGDDLPSQLDDFLRASRVVRVDPVSGERTELDFAPLFEPLAIELPGEAPRGGLYPDLSDLAGSKLFGTFAVCLDRTATLARRMQLVEALEESQADIRFPDAREDIRLLFVLGEGLVARTGEKPALVHDHPWMDYDVISATRGSEERTREESVAYRGFLQLLAARGVDNTTFEGLQVLNWMLAYDRVAIIAQPKPGAMPGTYRFQLDGHAIDWAFGRSDDCPAAVGDLRLRRILPDGSTASVADVFDSDRIVVELELDREIDASELEVNLGAQRPGAELEALDLAGVSGVRLSRAPGETVLYRSRVLRMPALAPGLPQPEPSDTLKVPLDATLLMALPRATPIVCNPVGARFAGDPGRVGHSWHTAWVHACERAGLDSSADWPSTKVVESLSAGGWLSFGKHNIELLLGDLASLYLIRDEILRELLGRRGEIEAFCTEVLSDDGLAERWYEVELRANARERQSRMGSLPLALEGVRGETLWEAFLWEPEVGVLRAKHARRVAREVARQLLSDLDAAIAHCRDISRDDPEQLIRLAGLGLDPVRERMLPNLLRRERIGDGVWWIPELAPKLHLPSIEGLHNQLIDAEALQDAELDVLVAIGGIVTPFAHVMALRGALYFGNRVVVGVRGATTFWEVAGGVSTVYNKSSQFKRQRAELAFARGATGVLSAERWQTSAAQVKPAWMLIAESVGSVVGAASEVLPLVQAVRLGRYQSPYAWTTKVSSKSAGVAPSAGAPPPRLPPSHVRPPDVPSGLSAADADPAFETTRIQTKDLPLSERVNALIERVEDGGLQEFRALDSDDRNVLLGALGLASDESAAAVRCLTEPVQRRLTKLMGSLEENLEVARAERFWEQDWFRSIGTEVDAEVPSPIRRPDFFPDANGGGWRLRMRTPDGEHVSVALGARIGEGVSAVVHALDEMPEGVIKLLKERDLAKAQAEIEVTLRTSERLAAAGIPHLRVLGSGSDGRVAFTLCERLPANAITLSRRVVRNQAGAVVHGGLRQLEVEGPLPVAFQHALAQLYKRLGRAGLVMEDGHLFNVYFFPNGLRWEAGLLDLDRILPWGSFDDADTLLENILHGMGQGFAHVNSMRGTRYFGDDAWDALIDADFAMQKMLEHKGMIAFDPRTGEWSGRRLSLEVVEQYFPGFRGHVGEAVNAVRQARR